MKKKVIVLTGAGISAESGISTFRDSDGLWEQYRVEDVATYDAYLRNPELVLNFYNERRRQLFQVKPNEGHRQLVRLEEKYDVHIITQNIDNLHEQAGSTQVLHLHGELTKARSDRNDDLIIDIGDRDIHLGDKAPDGAQLRPHIVWFGEAVPNIEPAAELCEKADYFIGLPRRRTDTLRPPLHTLLSGRPQGSAHLTTHHHLPGESWHRREKSGGRTAGMLTTLLTRTTKQRIINL